MVRMFAPFRRASVAYVWRRSWRRTSASSACARTRFQWCQSQVSLRGLPALPPGKTNCLRRASASEDLARGAREPHGPGPGLAVGKEEVPVAIVPPAKREDLVGSAPGQKEEAKDGDRFAVLPLRSGEACPEAPDLVVGEEPLAALGAVAPQAPAWIRFLGPVAEELRLFEDERDDGSGAVRGRGLRAKRREPALDVALGDGRDAAPGEPGEDLVAKVAAVDGEGAGLPDPPVAPESRLGDGLEQGLVGRGGRTLAPAGRRPQAHRMSPCFAYGSRVGRVDDLPHSAPAMLEMNKKALLSGWIYPDAKSFQPFIANRVNAVSGAKRAHARIGENGRWHRLLSFAGCIRGRNALFSGSYPQERGE